MALTDDDRRAIWGAFMREASNAHEPIPVLKAELRAAVDAIDQWINDNAASFNAAVPEPARSGLTAKQKLRLFMAVARRRWEIG